MSDSLSLAHSQIRARAPKVAIQNDGAFEGNVDVLMKTFVTNVAGPVYVSHAFLPLLEKGGKKTIVNISTTLGSIGTDFGPGQTSYSISKAALNMLVRPLAARGDI